MDIYEVVKKLIGDIDPVGETHTDEKRFENLKVMCEVADKLLTDIDGVIPNKRRQEHSMKKAGEYADEFYTRIGIVE